jgi:DMSO reductase anchor subunit
MIYASLPTVRAWHQPLVAPVYVVLGLATGGVLLAGLLAAFGLETRAAALSCALALAAGGAMKWLYWRAIDAEGRRYTAEAATGLGRFGTLRPLDPPHTQPNFVMREMGYEVARRHAQKLRQAAGVLLFLLPIAGALLLLPQFPGAVRVTIATVSALSAAAGVLIERWLFFAEAEHVVTLYYRGGAA